MSTRCFVVVSVSFAATFVFVFSATNTFIARVDLPSNADTPWPWLFVEPKAKTSRLKLLLPVCSRPTTMFRRRFFFAV